MVHRIAASALVGWMEHRKSFFYVRAYSRRHSTLFNQSRENHDVRLEPVRLPEPPSGSRFKGPDCRRLRKAPMFESTWTPATCVG